MRNVYSNCRMAFAFVLMGVGFVVAMDEGQWAPVSNMCGAAAFALGVFLTGWISDREKKGEAGS